MKKKLKLALPKGKLYENVVNILEDSGYCLSKNGRNYRPLISDPEIEIKLLKPQNIPKLVELGSQDIAFTGYDWVVEQDADVIELLDLNFDPVKLIVAIPDSSDFNFLKNNKIRVASEYEVISKQFLEKKGLDYVFIRSYGATEVFIPEDADMIIENLSTGKTLIDNNLKVCDEILNSSTRLIANRDSVNDNWKKKKINDFLMLIKSSLEGRKKRLIEMNIPKQDYNKLISVIPCMNSPTVSKLYGDEGYSVKIAVNKDDIVTLIPFLKENGAKDILISNIDKIVI